MEYTTYDFYTNKYYGESINADSFPKWLSRATDKLNWITRGNITSESFSIHGDRIQKATCALMDLLFALDKETKAANAKTEENIKSKSSGAESVSYSEKNTLYTKAIADTAVQNKMVYDTAHEYLSGTGLLYAGVG